jgi:hypothetical protein
VKWIRQGLLNIYLSSAFPRSWELGWLIVILRDDEVWRGSPFTEFFSDLIFQHDMQCLGGVTSVLYSTAAWQMSKRQDRKNHIFSPKIKDLVGLIIIPESNAVIFLLQFRLQMQLQTPLQVDENLIIASVLQSNFVEVACNEKVCRVRSF